MQRPLVLLTALVIAAVACGDSDADPVPTTTVAPEVSETTAAPEVSETTTAPEVSETTTAAATDDPASTATTVSSETTTVPATDADAALGELVIGLDDLPAGWVEVPEGSPDNELPAPDDPCFPVFALAAFSRAGGAALTPEHRNADGTEAANSGAFDLGNDADAEAIIGDLLAVDDAAACYTDSVVGSAPPGTELAAEPTTEVADLGGTVDGIDGGIRITVVLPMTIDGSATTFSIDQVILQRGRYVAGLQTIGLAGPVPIFDRLLDVQLERLATVVDG